MKPPGLDETCLPGHPWLQPQFSFCVEKGFAWGREELEGLSPQCRLLGMLLGALGSLPSLPAVLLLPSFPSFHRSFSSSGLVESRSF